MIYIIANALAGNGNGAKCLKKAEEILTARGAQFKTLVTEHAGHGCALAKQACADIRTRRILAIGGDGTLSEVLNGLDLSVPVSFVAAGTGNDFIHGCGLTDDVEQAVNAVLDGNVDLYDYLTVNNKRCLNIAGTGFDVDLLLCEQKIRKFLPGKFSYMLALFRALCTFKFTPITLSTDGSEPIDMPVFLIAAANGKYYGGGMKICLDAECNDGYIDLVIIKKLPRIAVPYVLIKFLKGELKQVTKYVETRRCKTLTIDSPTDLPINIDGELTDGLLPVTIEVKSRCLQVCR